MKYAQVDVVNVCLNFAGENRIKVGRLARKDRKIYFEYDQEFLQHELAISPIQLPLKNGVHVGDVSIFDGLHGVFNDSLPDGWGRLLMDRQLRRNNLQPDMLSPLDRLAYVGSHGMGALVYEPDLAELSTTENPLSLDRLASESQQVLEGKPGDILPELITLNSSSAGARPKIMVSVHRELSNIIYGSDKLENKNYTHWVIKFRSSHDPQDIAAIEYAYSLMAKDAGIDMMSTHVFPAQTGPGYFGMQRFDRGINRREHMHTASGLLNVDFRLPALDYQDLLRATQIVTRDQREVQKMFHLAVFNVLAHNRDDHSKNFSFLMNSTGLWQAAPAYDLTYSTGPVNEHSTMIMGEGRKPTKEHLIKLGQSVGLKQRFVRNCISGIADIVSQWPDYAGQADVTTDSKKLILKSINSMLTNK